jgi:hypothetical protein
MLNFKNGKKVLFLKFAVFGKIDILDYRLNFFNGNIF